ncbi:MAG: glycosyltransferase [Chromatiales bacterium]|nr:glycosyltransferase [Chromatiales bacterium]
MQPFAYCRNPPQDAKKALLCYVADPLVSSEFGDWHLHPNRRNAVTIATTITELGYSLDVIDCESTLDFDASDYSLIVGQGPAFTTALKSAANEAVKVLLGTELPPGFVRRALHARLNRLHSGRGGDYTEQRPEFLTDTMIDASDLVLCMDSAFAQQIWRQRADAVTRLAPGCLNDIPTIRFRNPFTARRRFLWMAGTGLVYKGLDLALEVFSSRPDLELHIFGRVRANPEFCDMYRRELFETPNISLHGFVDVRTAKYRSIARRCAWNLVLSCAEGGGDSVWTPMRSGLLPVHLRSAAIDADGFGVIIETDSIEAISAAVDRSAAISPAEWYRQYRRLQSTMRRRFTSQRLQLSLTEALTSIDRHRMLVAQ